jgi:hypothetical protein
MKCAYSGLHLIEIMVVVAILGSSRPSRTRRTRTTSPAGRSPRHLDGRELRVAHGKPQDQRTLRRRAHLRRAAADAEALRDELRPARQRPFNIKATGNGAVTLRLRGQARVTRAAPPVGSPAGAPRGELLGRPQGRLRERPPHPARASIIG